VVLLIKAPTASVSPPGPMAVAANAAATSNLERGWISEERARACARVPLLAAWPGSDHCRPCRNDLQSGGGSGARPACGQGLALLVARRWRAWGLADERLGPQSSLPCFRGSSAAERPGPSLGRSTPAEGFRKLGVARCAAWRVRFDPTPPDDERFTPPSYPEKLAEPAESGEVQKPDRQGAFLSFLSGAVTVACWAWVSIAAQHGSWF